MKTHTTMVLLALAALTGCGNGDPAADHADHAVPQDHQEQDVHDHGAGMVQISDALARRLGVTFVEARVEDLERTIRATGEVVWDETRLSTVSLRFGGWAEHLHVDFTGRFVEAGEPLLEVYSPELVSAQEDLLSAKRLARELAGSRVPGSVDRSESVVEAARDRLRYWNVAEEDIQKVEETGQVEPQLTLQAPFTGYVVAKEIQDGQRFDAGSTLYRLADLSRVWIEVDVYERDLRFVGVGSAAEVEVAAYPGEVVRGDVTYIHPDVQRDRRTARVRLELPNPDGRLKPGMYGTARLQVTVARDAVTVPRDAVMHTGERALVFVAHGDGTYETRTVELGAEAADRVQILDGLEAGEAVVARAGFILDAESRLMEAMMGQPDMPGMEMDTEMDDMDMDDPEHPEQDGGHDHSAHGGGGPDA